MASSLYNPVIVRHGLIATSIGPEAVYIPPTLSFVPLGVVSKYRRCKQLTTAGSCKCVNCVRSEGNGNLGSLAGSIMSLLLLSSVKLQLLLLAVVVYLGR